MKTALYVVLALFALRAFSQLRSVGSSSAQLPNPFAPTGQDVFCDPAWSFVNGSGIPDGRNDGLMWAW